MKSPTIIRDKMFLSIIRRGGDFLEFIGGLKRSGVEDFLVWISLINMVVLNEKWNKLIYKELVF